MYYVDAFFTKDWSTSNTNNSNRLLTTNSDKSVNLKKDPYFSIFTNPVKEKLNILIEVQNTGPLSISLFDLSGKQVYEIPHPRIEQSYQLVTLKNLKFETGQYVLKIRLGDVIKTKQVVFE